MEVIEDTMDSGKLPVSVRQDEATLKSICPLSVDSPQLPLDSPLMIDSPMQPGDSPATSDGRSTTSAGESPMESPMYDDPSPSSQQSMEENGPSSSASSPSKETFPCSECGRNSSGSADVTVNCTSCSKTELTGSDSVKISDSSTKKRDKPNTATLRFPPCFVCSGKASGLHYGVNSCEACKGFFRRYLLRNEVYKCTKGGNCSITNRSRGNCSGCRLAKCLKLGMSKCASRLGRYTVSQRTKTIMEVKCLESQNDSSPAVLDLTTSIDSLTNEQQGQRSNTDQVPIPENPKEILKKPQTSGKNVDKEIESLGSDYDFLLATLTEATACFKPFGSCVDEKDIDRLMKEHFNSYSMKVNMFGKMKAVPEEEYYLLLKKYGIDVDDRMSEFKDPKFKKELEECIERFVTFAKQVPGFTNLPLSDQSNLLKVGRFDVFLILMHKGYIAEHEVFMTFSGKPYHLEEVADKFFSRELLERILDIYGRWQKLNLTKEEMAVLLGLSLTFQDRCKLENRSMVDQMQEMLVDILWKCLLRSCPENAVRRFAKFIDTFVTHREAAELYFKEYQALCSNDILIDEMPMMMEFLLDDW